MSWFIDFIFACYRRYNDLTLTLTIYLHFAYLVYFSIFQSCNAQCRCAAVRYVLRKVSVGSLSTIQLKSGHLTNTVFHTWIITLGFAFKDDTRKPMQKNTEISAWVSVYWHESLWNVLQINWNFPSHIRQAMSFMFFRLYSSVFVILTDLPVAQQ